MDSEQPSFTDVEYGNRRRVSRREQFLETMDATIPWATWVGLIEPHYYSDRPGKTGRKAKPVATMLRMYLLQVWFNLSDEGVEDAIYDSYAMRRFMDLDFAIEQVPDATTLLHFRHLLEAGAQAQGLDDRPVPEGSLFLPVDVDNLAGSGVAQPHVCPAVLTLAADVGTAEHPDPGPAADGEGLARRGSPPQCLPPLLIYACGQAQVLLAGSEGLDLFPEQPGRWVARVRSEL